MRVIKIPQNFKCFPHSGSIPEVQVTSVCFYLEVTSLFLTLLRVFPQQCRAKPATFVLQVFLEDSIRSLHSCISIIHTQK